MDPTKNKAVLKESRRARTPLNTRRVVLLLPVLIGFKWTDTYLSIYLTKDFLARSIIPGALISGLAATFANIFWGWHQT